MRKEVLDALTASGVGWRDDYREGGENDWPEQKMLAFFVFVFCFFGHLVLAVQGQNTTVHNSLLSKWANTIPSVLMLAICYYLTLPSTFFDLSVYRTGQHIATRTSLPGQLVNKMYDLSITPVFNCPLKCLTTLLGLKDRDVTSCTRHLITEYYTVMY